MDPHAEMSRPLHSDNGETIQGRERSAKTGGLGSDSYLDIAQLAAHICNVSVAYISVKQGQHQRIVATAGTSTVDGSLDGEQCIQAISTDKGGCVEAVHTLTSSDSVLPPEVRFFAGVPLLDSNSRLIGTLCILDTKPRSLRDEQKDALMCLARQAAAQLEAASQISRLQERIQCFESCLDRSPVLVTIKDAQGVYRYANATFRDLAGKGKSSVVGRTDDELWPADMAARMTEHDSRVRQTGVPYSTSEALSLPGTVRRLWHVHRYMMKGTQGLLASVGCDITEWKDNEQQLLASQELLKQSLENLEVLSVTDGLTGLHNRRAFEERMKEEFERARRYNLPLSLLMLDADRFKEFNDSLGHPAGDHLLKELAVILKQNARANDLPARFGGDEFAVILPNTDSKVAFHLAERLRRAVKALCFHDHLITISVGVAALRPEMSEAHALLVAADQALYDAKRKGRNRVSHSFGVCLEQ